MLAAGLAGAWGAVAGIERGIRNVNHFLHFQTEQ
jgi:hypothetical protein